ncbi:MAG TPA: transporter, partial [Alphaproteobacteria bacterium]|nr:transporter [Alphaproteobacteria bacterium]
MYYSNHLPFRRFLVACLIFMLAGCSPAPEAGPMGASEQVNTLRQDLRSLFAGEELEAPLTLHEAMARGILHNLDHRLARAQEAVANGDIRLATLDAFPDLDLKGQYIGRSNEGASSSRSV